MDGYSLFSNIRKLQEKRDPRDLISVHLTQPVESHNQKIRKMTPPRDWPRFCFPPDVQLRVVCRRVGAGCRPRRAMRARAGSHPCEKQALAITQDAGDPPRGRAIRIPAGEIIARRTVLGRVGTWLGTVLVFSHYLIEKEAFNAIVGAVTASATTGSWPAPTAPRASQRPAHCSASTRLLSRRKSSRISHRSRRLCCAALPAPALRRPHDCNRGLRARLRAKVAADPKQDRHIMSQTACERRHVLAPMRWLHAGGDLSRHNHANQRADRPLIRSTRPPRCPLNPSRPPSHPIQVAWRPLRAHQHGRREDQIPIALAAQPAPNFPRLRALALFGRRPPECEAPLVIPASKNLHKCGPASRAGYSPGPLQAFSCSTA